MRDEELRRATAQDAEDSAFAKRLVEDYAPLVHRYFRSLASADADDLGQQTLLACLDAAKRFRGESSFRTYLLRIARYQRFAHYRGRKRDRRLAEAWSSAVDDLQFSIEAEEQPSDEDLRCALARLSRELRDVLTIVYLRGQTRASAAAILGIPEGTVASRLRRALEQARVELQANMLDAQRYEANGVD